MGPLNGNSSLRNINSFTNSVVLKLCVCVCVCVCENTFIDGYICIESSGMFYYYTVCVHHGGGGDITEF